MTASVHGIHHVTCIAGNAQENLNFYVGLLGMRLVKKSVNQDATDTYHLFYADRVGNPGTDFTFFPWPDNGATTPTRTAIPTKSLERIAPSTRWSESFSVDGRRA